MLFHGQSFNERLKFFELNICDFPEELSIEDIYHSCPEEVKSGLQELRQLFAQIYASEELFKEEDTLESLHNVTNTVMLLYSAGFTGTPGCTGIKWNLTVDKKQLKSHYKQSMNKPIEMLQHFGFYYEYFKNGKQVETLNKCSEFVLYCDQWNNIPLALSCITKNTELSLEVDDYTRIQGLFYKLDYKSMFLKESTKREDLDPFRADILRTAGMNKQYFEEIVKNIITNYPLKTKIKFHEYYTPHWILQFYTEKNDKFLFNLNVAADTLCLEIRMSAETLEELAKRKMEFPEQLRIELDKFGCISCSKKCSGENLRDINGISCCMANSEARLLMLYISSKEEMEAAISIIDFENKNSSW